ncbi:hypothetical protein BJ165DRAFT_1535461 [Panaeolus papilionaceus]|nr:hypothetical protein BJ165DRAFT_1535461 [Panaeolus papilionaceus]
MNNLRTTLCSVYFTRGTLQSAHIDHIKTISLSSYPAFTSPRLRSLSITWASGVFTIPGGAVSFIRHLKLDSTFAHALPLQSLDHFPNLEELELGGIPLMNSESINAFLATIPLTRFTPSKLKILRIRCFYLHRATRFMIARHNTAETPMFPHLRELSASARSHCDVQALHDILKETRRLERLFILLSDGVTTGLRSILQPYTRFSEGTMQSLTQLSIWIQAQYLPGALSGSLADIAHIMSSISHHNSLKYACLLFIYDLKGDGMQQVEVVPDDFEKLAAILSCPLRYPSLTQVELGIVLYHKQFVSLSMVQREYEEERLFKIMITGMSSVLERIGNGLTIVARLNSGSSPIR